MHFLLIFFEEFLTQKHLSMFIGHKTNQTKGIFPLNLHWVGAGGHRVSEWGLPPPAGTLQGAVRRAESQPGWSTHCMDEGDAE